jgi:hypothetical protein
LFYELAHGASTYFQAHQPGIYYYASDVEDAMVNREKMRFAFIGSCEGMTNTDEGTFSHAFRKGAITETVTIGYSGMGSCPGWSVSLEWQDTMFYAMDSGYTIREAFDYANGQYPTIADCVVFVGDSDMHIVEIDPDDPEIDIIPPNVLITSPQTNDYVAGTVKVTGKAHDLDGMVKHVYVKIDEDDWVLAEGTDEWEFVLDTSVLSNGLHQIQAISVDDDGFQSGINRIAINVSNSPLTISTTIPSQGLVNQPVQCFAYASGGIPPYRFLWDFGDGTGSNDEDPAHSYNQPGTYQITVTITDQGNITDTKSSSITIRPNDTTPPSIQLIHPYGGCFVNNQMLFSMDPILIFGPVNITIDAVDDTGPVVAINWYLNDEKILFPTQKSMRWRWDERYFGRFDIDIVAFDAAGNQGDYELIGYKFF